MSDLDLVCAECGVAFVFTAAEGEFYEAQGLVAPKRCRSCRRARKQRASAPPSRAGFDITCATCGKPARVPFEPEAGRDVYCQPCYRARRCTLRADADPGADGGTDSGIVE
jgi:CxxC-x17-CxxC domain-containing protein